MPEENGSGYRFHHSLVREAVSDSLLPGERARSTDSTARRWKPMPR